MKSVSGKHEVRMHDLVVLAVLVAGIVGVTALAVSDPSVDASRIQPIRSALAVPRIVSQSTGPVSAARPARVVEEEKWAADESSHGLRPDAAH